ncbi:MAG: M28 family peptidase [Halobacteriota archaeon]
MTSLAEIAGDGFTNDYLWDLYEGLTDIGNRLTGSDGEHKSAALLRRRFENAGLRDAHIEEYEAPTWERGSASLRVDGNISRAFDGSHEILGLPGSPPETVEAAVVDIGPGLPESFADHDVAGKIVLVSSQNPPDYGRAMNRIEKYCLAEEHDAVGFLYYNDVPGCITPTGAIGFARDGTGTIPAAGITREVSRRILRWLERDSMTATLSIDATVDRGTSKNVEAVVGPDTDREIIVSGHHDAHDIADGARDNAAGTVLAAEVGRLLSNVDDLETSVRIIAFGGEETGLYGSHHWVQTHDPSSVKALVNLDGIGFSRSLRLGGDETIAEAFHSVGDELHVPVESEPGLSPFTDAWPFGREGVPVVVGRSASEGSGQVVRYGHQEWGHTHADTIDKIDQRDMRDLAIQLAAGVRELSSDAYQPEHRTTETVHAELPAALNGYLERSGRLDRYL